MSIPITILTMLGFPRIELAESVGRHPCLDAAAFRANVAKTHWQQGIPALRLPVGKSGQSAKVRQKVNNSPEVNSCK
ncbi:MAG: hypothetical protein JO066_01660 [Verrucomicrobia bacterium]|nr:hypothetical protein [Verrucomicrobiota bacterium]